MQRKLLGNDGVLPLLDDAELDLALIEGRDELASLTGSSIDLLAYPYGSVDARVAGATERAGQIHDRTIPIDHSIAATNTLITSQNLQ